MRSDRFNLIVEMRKLLKKPKVIIVLSEINGLSKPIVLAKLNDQL